MKQKTLFVVMSLLLIAALFTGCTKKAANEVPKEQTQGQETAGTEPSALPSEQLPTGDAAIIDSDLNQEEVDSDVADLEQTLSDW
ncbi:MAG: hypothetical protein NDI94_02625 [Candidatus Woesearchaeota archaeon]|nr:hypothetical protein [Candidatus Woesearchaeota archaeon]